MANLLDRLLGPTPKKTAPARTDAPWDDRGVDAEYPLPGEPHETPPAGHAMGELGGPSREPWADTLLRWQDQLPATEESGAVTTDVADERSETAPEAAHPSLEYDTVPTRPVTGEHTPLFHDGMAIRGTLHCEPEQFPLTANAAPVRILGRQWTRDTAAIVNQGTADAWIGTTPSMTSTSASFKIPAGGAYTTRYVGEMYALALAAGANLNVIQEHNG